MGSGSEFQVVSAANENDLQPYFFNFANDNIQKYPVKMKILCILSFFFLYAIIK